MIPLFLPLKILTICLTNSTKILLARSPSHLHSISSEYSKATNSTLTTSIREVFSGMLRKILLHTVENSEGINEGGAGICELIYSIFREYALTIYDYYSARF